MVLAAVAGAHGLGGEVRLKLFTDDLARYRDVTVGDRPLELLGLRGEIARFSGVADRSAAEMLRGCEVAVPRSALPALGPGEYYHADLVGLPCSSTDGTLLGHVVTVENYGAGDLLEIARPDGTRFMVPMRPEAVPDWTADMLVVAAAFVDR